MVNDLDRNNLYLASLLHDIGYFEKMAYGLEDRHEDLSIKLLEDLKFIQPTNRYEIAELIKNHHNPESLLELMVTLGDLLSCNEEGYIEDRDGKEAVNLSSIFQFINKEDYSTEGAYKYSTKKLGGENIFPVEKIDNNNYKEHFLEFKKEIGKVKNESQLLFLIEKYLWCIPIVEKSINDKIKREDISLYHHLRTSSAISIALYDELKNEEYRDIKDKFLHYENGEIVLNKEINDETFILINGDISGIQEFLLNVESKQAAKTLKGNSVYINILTDIVANYMFDRLNLKESNLIYNGGGTFFILTSMNKRHEVENLINDIVDKIFKIHRGDIFYGIDYIEISPSEFIDFASQWTRAIEKTNRQKEKKWSQLNLEKNYSQLFEKFDDGVTEGEHCRHCGVPFQSYDETKDNDICTFCSSSTKLTDKIRNAKYLIVKNKDIEDETVIKSYEEGFELFGYSLEFVNKIEDQIQSETQKTYLINDYDFLNVGNLLIDGYKIGAYQLPMKDDKKFSDFDELALKSVGRGNLSGVLKLDVDNLGNVFRLGLGKNKTIARMMTLSKMMTLFFEGYVNELLNKRIKDIDTKYESEDKFKDTIYLVYSGGDDTFLIGGWYEVYIFAKLFKNEFERYVCRNSTVTFSAGLGFFNVKYPVINSIEITESYLNDAKEYKRKNESSPQKNKINLMGEIFNWSELNSIDEFVSILDEAIKRLGKDKTKGKSILWKVEKSSIGFKGILEDSNRNKLHPGKIAKLAYYLRDLKKEEIEDYKEEDHVSDKILKKYKEIVISNSFNEHDENIENIMIIPVATKITELKNRDREEKNDDSCEK